MNNFILLYQSPISENTIKSNLYYPKQAWQDWKNTIGNQLLDQGAPLMTGQKILSDSFVMFLQKEVTGYSIIQARNISEAKLLLAEHPHLRSTEGAEILVHEAIKL